MSNPRDVPFETTHLVRDTCLCLHVQRAARALSRLFDDALRPVGLTIPPSVLSQATEVIQ